MARNGNQRRHEAAIRPAEPAAHWKALKEGDRVRILITPGYETGGFVDAITSDCTSVWVNLDGGLGRTMLHCSDDVEIVPQGA
ncbi:hypothetical protein PY310_07790 [Pseudarthrobacter sp. H3Y2-7]|jgi:hypothetical protein|uniref:hypothetical protein n=1 Tax=Pseudarthrobacter TaxID=1742993 RepID=UPI0023B1C391|nr:MULTISPECIES: hypothetical protein [unclassified Pseudarthrobacter]MDE8668481.1 hypothetical protein [Pseudarthrobacter sp. H3Y2-7]